VADALREAIHRSASVCGGDVALAAAEVGRAGGEAVLAVLFFGSRKTRPSDDPWSAHDFFVVVSGYREFYTALKANGQLRRSPLLVSALNGWLPPNQVSIRPRVGERTLHAKCAVLSMAALARETSPARRDHFCAGRLFQPVELAWARGETAAGLALDAVVNAHRLTYAWGRPYLPADFDAPDYAQRLLEVSMAQEIRPEPPGRAAALFDSQREYHRHVYPALLGELHARGELRDCGGGRYALVRPASSAERARQRWFFRWSLVRATARWAKYMITFEGWLEYIVHKAERHGGASIVLSERERRWPVLFLWPRLLRYLRRKNRP
jgi:hypothetical protein